MTYKILGSIALMSTLLILGAWNLHTTVSAEHTFNASEADLWRIWNDPASVEKWWGPKGYTGLVVQNDVRRGGSYLWAMKSEKGKMFWNTGTYTEVIPKELIASTMAFSNESGKVIPGSQVSVPGKWPDEITVIVRFRESGGKSSVTVTEAGIPLITYPLMKLGWHQQFAKIQSLL